MKLVIVTPGDSTILRQLDVLKDFKFEVEVCPSAYSRHYDHFSGRQLVEQGLLRVPRLP
jgi:hypothetical protein